jgi:hypothetical protein
VVWLTCLRIEAKLRVCLLWGKKLSGSLPGGWSGLVELKVMAISTNALTGAVPPSALYGNRRLSGCLPRAWHGRVNVRRTAQLANLYYGGDLATAGTHMTGYC